MVAFVNTSYNDVTSLKKISLTVMNISSLFWYKYAFVYIKMLFSYLSYPLI